MSSQAPLLYERVARLVETQISTGTLRANERIPSVRSMSRTARVSVSTVVQAYVHLENIGLIEARPQSGFYVRPPDPQAPARAAAEGRAHRAAPCRSRPKCSTRVARRCRAPTSCRSTARSLRRRCIRTQRLNNLVREVLRDHPLNAGRDASCRRATRSCGDRSPSAWRSPARRPIPTHVVITSGTMDAITLTLQIVCQPGDTVLVESPTYFGLLQAIEHLDLKVVEVPNHPRSRHRRRCGAHDRAQHAPRRCRADAELQQSRRQR